MEELVTVCSCGRIANVFESGEDRVTECEECGPGCDAEKMTREQFEKMR